MGCLLSGTTTGTVTWPSQISNGLFRVTYVSKGSVTASATAPAITAGTNTTVLNTVTSTSVQTSSNIRTPASGDTATVATVITIAYVLVNAPGNVAATVTITPPGTMPSSATGTLMVEQCNTLVNV